MENKIKIMTLNEKFHQWLSTEPFNSREIPTLREAQCVVIADEFAIGFADWIRVCKLKGRPYDFENIKELLEIYKNEKGL
jgi:hypothetical protein